ncbi:MAG TPA: peptide deformylase [Anaerolineales bacterium]|nr:peptide deformylase [Anaerolineales bacterium]
MSLRTIITAEDPRLRQRARKVRAISPALQTLIDDMTDTMRAAPGVGLAATQLAVGQRVIVVEFREDGADPEAPQKLFVVVNPDITHRSNEMVDGVEGCLSIPGYAGDVERHAWVTVKGLNRHGRPFRLKARGWLARIFQHEIDHLDGVLFIDRATRVWKPEPEPAEPEVTVTQA